MINVPTPSMFYFNDIKGWLLWKFVIVFHFFQSFFLRIAYFDLISFSPHISSLAHQCLSSLTSFTKITVADTASSSQIFYFPFFSKRIMKLWNLPSLFFKGPLCHSCQFFLKNFYFSPKLIFISIIFFYPEN